MDIGKVVEIGERKIDVTPRRETTPQQPERAPATTPEREREAA